MKTPIFSILITTKNRISDLKFTLQKIGHLLDRDDVECIICDDGSQDGTFAYIKTTYPTIQVFRNDISKGLIYSRNRLLERTTAQYAISLDDDLHFITEQPLEEIESFFKESPLCAVLTFRIFWSLDSPHSTEHHQKIERVKSFAGGAHVWRMDDWKAIANYPEWFIFYGEEDFASFNLFKKDKFIYYYPNILCHHRVNVKGRKKHDDYMIRLRRSLRSGWYLYLLFYPLKLIPRKFGYSFWIQLKLRVFKGDLYAFMAMLQALGDVVLHIPKLIKNSNRLTNKEFKEFSKLADVKLYWTPEDEKK